MAMPPAAERLRPGRQGQQIVLRKEAETNQIALGVIVETESMESAADTRFQVGQQDVDPAKLGAIIGVTPTGYSRSVATACYDDRAEASEPIRDNRADTR